MNLKEAMTCAYWVMQEELDRVEEMPEESKQFLYTSEACLNEAIRVIRNQLDTI